MSELHWIDEIAEFTPEDQARIIERINGNVETREVRPGVWEHTFTPEPFIDLSDLFYNVPVAPTGMLSASDIDAMLEGMFSSARAHPDMLYVSPGTLHAIRHAQRIGRLFRAHPVPRGKIRKCHMRKLQARWRVGKAHIRRVERAERAREEAAMRNGG